MNGRRRRRWAHAGMRRRKALTGRRRCLSARTRWQYSRLSLPQSDRGPRRRLRQEFAFGPSSQWLLCAISGLQASPSEGLTWVKLSRWRRSRSRQFTTFGARAYFRMVSRGLRPRRANAWGVLNSSIRPMAAIGLPTTASPSRLSEYSADDLVFVRIKAAAVTENDPPRLP